MKYRAPFDANFLRSILRYNRRTGAWTWRTNAPHVLAGRRAGSINKDGYLNIGINRQQFRASRLAILYVTGKWPKETVDHKDGNPSNEKWTNIRPASRAQNQANRRGWARKNKLKGVFARNEKYRAAIGHNGRTFWLGTFTTAQAAHAAYAAASKKYHGSFGRIA